MTDLSKGIVSFDELIITPQTKKEDLLNSFGEKLSAASSDRSIKFKKSFFVDGFEFSCWFFFDENYKISSIQLTPYIDYKSEEWDRTGQQAERRKFCDKWLFERLGEPHQSTTNVTHYYFNIVEVYSLSHFDLREGADAGYIIIEFKN